MATEKLLQELKKLHDAYETARREVIALASKAQHASKRAIFAVQRDDEKGAKALLTEAEAALEAIRERAASAPRLAHEGSYRAALEEYAEARFTLQLVAKGEASGVEGLDEETQIAGLCDAVGELVRMMTIRATEKRDKEVRELKARVDEVLAGLSAMDFSGYLRTKFDQSRGHLRRAEEIMYDLSLRDR